MVRIARALSALIITAALTLVVGVPAPVAQREARAASPAASVQRAGSFPSGTVAGQVTDAGGPVGGAVVELVSDHHGYGGTGTTNPDGTFSIATSPGTYTASAVPPEGSSDGAFTGGPVNVTVNQTTPLNPVLPPAPAAGSFSGVATYDDGTPGSDLMVDLTPLYAGPARPEYSHLPDIYTGADGHWKSGQIPAGGYRVSFQARTPSVTTNVGHTYVVVVGGQDSELSATVSGARSTIPAPGTLSGTVRASGIPAAFARINLVPQTGNYPGASATTDLAGHFSVDAPAGPYRVTVSPNQFGADLIYDATSVETSIEISRGATAHADFDLPPLPQPSGVAAHDAQRYVDLLNEERARWGLPGGISLNTTWADGCAAHDNYLALNNVLQHPESPSAKGYSAVGNWAGTHAILSEGSGWTAAANPWEDAPYHLAQLMQPDIVTTGIDGSSGYFCMTTWPGMLGHVSPVGTVYTYPGDGTTDFPPAENAREIPGVPGDTVGLPQGTLAGRELFVYQDVPPEASGCTGGCNGVYTPALQSASLAGPDGPVAIKVVDAGGFSPADIIIPVKPLAANTRYTATVTLPGVDAQPLAGMPGRPSVTHSWSFTTGPANPSGRWPGSCTGCGGSDDSPHPAPNPRPHSNGRRPTLKVRRVGRNRARVTGRNFEPRRRIVLITAHTRRRHVMANASGAFRVLVRLSTRRLQVRAKQGHRTAITYLPARRRA